MISRKSEAVLNRAGQFALEKNHEYCTLEHVFWSLLQDGSVLDIIEACGGKPAKMLIELEAYLDKEVPQNEIEPNEIASLEPPVATLGVQRLVQRALFHVQSSGKDQVLPADLLVALFQAKESFSLLLLKKQNIERLDVLSFISHGLRKDDDIDSSEPTHSLDEEGGSEARSSAEDSNPLRAFTSNLNELAKNSKIDPLIGRQIELDRMIQTLCRRRKNNPLLVGEAGVGKTALAEGLAVRIEAGQIPDLLEKAEVYSLDLGSLARGNEVQRRF